MKRTILIVDDSESMRQLLSLTLRDEGYEVISASDGCDALAKLSSGRVDMAITDLYMPGMDGLEFIRCAHGTPGCESLPIVVLTSEFREFKKQEGKKAGASEWIEKPFKTEKLKGVIKKFAG